MTRALRLLESVCLAAFTLGVYLWALIAFFWLRSGEAGIFAASVALAGATLIAGIWGVAAWSARAILRTGDNMRAVRRRLDRAAAPKASPDDISERLTLDAMRRARQSYERERAGFGEGRLTVGDLRKGGAL